MDATPQNLRDLRKASGLSLREMAKALVERGEPYTYSALSRYETDGRPVPPHLVQMYGAIAAANAPGDPVATLIALGSPDMNRRRFLRTSAYTAAGALLPLNPIDPAPTEGRIIGHSEVQALHDTIAGLTAIDEQAGGAVGREAIEVFCSTTIPTYLRSRYANNDVRRRMFDAAAQATYLAGWKAHDVAEEARAQEYYRAARAFATEADGGTPGAHTAFIRRVMCHQAFNLGHGHELVAYAEGALELIKGHTEPHTEAMFTITAARAHAIAGDRHRALSYINTAEHQIALPPGQAPSWAAGRGSAAAQVHNHIGQTLRTLGDLAGAEEKARHALELWDSQTHTRIWAITYSRVAQAQYDQGNHADAAATWNRVLPALDGIQSERIDKLRATATEHLNTHH